MDAAFPIVCSPNRRRPIFTSVETGSSSTGCGARKSSHVVRYPGRAERPARPRRHERRELGVRYTDTRVQVLRHRVQQRGHDSRLAPVQLFQSIHPHVRRADLGALDPVADSLQRGEHLPEDSTVVGLVRIQHDGIGVARHRLLRGHADHHPGRFREAVHHNGYPHRRVTVDDQRGPPLQVGPPSHLRLCSQVRDENTSYSHIASSITGTSGTVAVDITELVF